MCFSVQADVTVGLLLLPVAAASLRETRHLRELPFAALPLVFALHQFMEALVWAGADGDVSAQLQHAAAFAYLVIALPVLPTLMPLAVLLLEPRGARRRVAPFVLLGVVVSTYLGYALLTGPFEVVAHPHALEYDTTLWHGNSWAVLYIAAVIGPSLMSGYRSLVAFGLLNLVGLTAVAVVYQQAFVSLWCVYAACASVLMLLHMVRRRRLPDDQRLRGEPIAGGFARV
jgi:hypothetical protein